MKNIFKTSLLLLGVLVVFFACKKEELDTAALTDFPPGILSVTPGENSIADAGENFDVTVKFISGSVSTLASATVKLTNEAGDEVAAATETLSGTNDSLVIAGSSFNASALPVGKYKLVIAVTDIKGKTQNRTVQFEVGVQLKIGIIGDATPGGWGVDTDMANKGSGVYETVITLGPGKVKFRANDAWTINWGGADFPSGIGTQDGPDIPSQPGIWKVTFTPSTGAYKFESAVTYASNATALYLLGTFNNFEGDDYKFTLVADNTWVLNEILLKPGDLFRFYESPNFTGKNWGDDNNDGKAEESSNSHITFNAPEGEAYYKVTFNDKTRIYKFDFIKFPSIGIIGSATPTGWDSDTDMTDKGNGDFEISMTLTDGAVKFRANDSWDTNWGGATFPSGTAVPGGADIMVTAGAYIITFNPTTLAYNFEPDAGFTDIGIIGNATPGGWDTDTDMKDDDGDGTFELVIGLSGGFVKFRANNSWDVAWGGSSFPSGTGSTSGSDIAVTKGIYLVSFTPATGEYNFAPASIGLVGDATPGGWNTDTDMVEDAATAGVVNLSLTLVDGKAKFRVNDDWKYNWGAGDFPSGVGTPGGADIPIPAGTYNVTFNVNTGAYSFN